MKELFKEEAESVIKYMYFYHLLQERGALRRRLLPEVPSKSLPRPPKKPLREQSDSRSRERRGGGGLEVVNEGGQKRSHSHGDDLEVRSFGKSNLLTY